MKQVLIVEDQRMPRKYMESMISDSKYYALAASISGADIALAYCKRQMIDLILMDVCTSGNKDGIEAAAEIKAAFPNIKIIIVTSMVEVGFLERAKAAKVDSFWYKDPFENKLLDIMNRTMMGESIYPDQSPTSNMGLATSSEFTERELDVLRELISGDTDEMIAERLNLSVHTIKKHVKSMFQKTGCTTRTQLAVMALESGIVVRGF